ncbi:MAG: lytic murein transglycosylase [Deltaproteobacteria bacterium]
MSTMPEHRAMPRPARARAAPRIGIVALALHLALGVLVGASEAGAHHGEKRMRSWQHLTDRLIADGIARSDVERAFRDRRVGAFDGVDYALVVRDPKRSYRDFRKRHSLRAAKACRRRYAHDFETFGSEHGVDPDVLAAILYIETRCGSYTGNRVVLRQLARLAMANEPTNIADNIRRHKKEDEEGFTPGEIERLARERALYLHQTFYPEVRATFRLADKVGINPVGLRGSGAGAFGWPQFLPSSYLRFAQDGNANGRISLYEPSDAIRSVAHFLRGHGWKPGLSAAQKRKPLWQYNRSEPYIDTILFVANAL